MTQQATWKGSSNTAQVVYKQILERWGEDEANRYDPRTNCFTYQTWKQKGYIVKRGEKALRSFTFVKENDVTPDDEQVTRRSYPKQVCLFYILQVEPMSKK